MPRIKQSLRKRAKAHVKRSLALRARKNKLKGARRRSLSQRSARRNRRRRR